MPVPLPFKSVLPGQWLGLIGGGQLGRMFCHAAQSMGYKVAVLEPASPCPAGVVADLHIQAAYDNPQGLDQLAALCMAVTTEFENVPADSLAWLADRGVAVSPAAASVAQAQDRIREKRFIEQAGVPVAPHMAIEHPDQLEDLPPHLLPGILKVARLGYDGKGQARVATPDEARSAFHAFQGVPCVLEALLPLKEEISVVLARGWDDACVTYLPARNVHRDGILAVSTVNPAPDAANTALDQQAAQAALSIAKALNYRGVLCVEFFVLQDGSLVANEIAPRPHNSGHHTIDACVTSQFEQQVRVMAGLPLGDTTSHSASIMLNLLGDLWYFDDTETQREPNWAGVLACPGAKLHLYGKAQARRGRKMGHVTVVGTTLAVARQRAAQVADVLGLSL